MLQKYISVSSSESRPLSFHTVCRTCDIGGVSWCIFSFCVLISSPSGVRMKTIENIYSIVPENPVLYFLARTETTHNHAQSGKS